jgi:pseudouridine 5'-phosphatase
MHPNMFASPSFPPVRACIFDMDGLLIDSEEAYTLVTNQILRENNRPDVPWHIKAQLQGRPGPAAGRIFHEWAQLPISEAQFMVRQRELQAEAFKHCKPLPGVEWMLKTLGDQGQMAGGKKVHLALATSSHRGNYEIKTMRMKEMFKVFPEGCIITGDDMRIPRGRGKPLPDIYLLALKTVNESLEHGEREISPEECLVFEDSVPGIEAGRRAGMRVVWCPHPGLLGEYQGREKEVLAGKTGEHKDEEMIDNAGPSTIAGSPGHVGEVDDGWAEFVPSLEGFDFKKYGIDIVEQRYRTESGQSASPGTTDKELEEMTAIADGKSHASEEGSRFGNGDR